MPEAWIYSDESTPIFSNIRWLRGSGVRAGRVSLGRGDLNPRLALIISGLQPKSWHKAVICRDAGMNVPFLDHLKQLYRL